LQSRHDALKVDLEQQILALKTENQRLQSALQYAQTRAELGELEGRELASLMERHRQLEMDYEAVQKSYFLSFAISVKVCLVCLQQSGLIVTHIHSADEPIRKWKDCKCQRVRSL
jgi:hypothetical protein